MSSLCRCQSSSLRYTGRYGLFCASTVVRTESLKLYTKTTAVMLCGCFCMKKPFPNGSFLISYCSTMPDPRLETAVQPVFQLPLILFSHPVYLARPHRRLGLPMKVTACRHDQTVSLCYILIISNIFTTMITTEDFQAFDALLRHIADQVLLVSDRIDRMSDYCGSSSIPNQPARFFKRWVAYRKKCCLPLRAEIPEKTAAFRHG